METLEDLKEYIEVLETCLMAALSKKKDDYLTMVLVRKADLKAYITGELGSKENQKKICDRIDKAAF